MRYRKTVITMAVLLAAGAAGSRIVASRAAAAVPHAMVMTATEQLRQRDLQIKAWSEALKADPESAISLAQLAGLYLQRGRESGNYENYSQAEALARRSLKLRTQRNGMTYVTLSSALLAQHKFAEARMVAHDIVELYPETPEYRALLGETALELGDYAAARKAFNGVLANRTHLSIAPRLARWSELNGRVNEARELLEGAMMEARTRNLPPEQMAWFHLRVAELELHAGNMRAARSAIDAGLALVPEDFRLLGAMARLKSAEGDNDGAIEYGERSIPERMDPVTLGLLSDAYAASGDQSKAEDYSASMQLVVTGQPGPYHRAWSVFLLDHDRDIPEVLAKAQEEIAMRRDIYGYDILGWALYKSHRNGEAADAARAALQLNTPDATLWFHAGMIERAVGNNAAAITDLTRALEINDRFHPVHAKEARAALKELKSAQ